MTYKYCANCDNEATKVVIHTDADPVIPGTKTPFCKTCADAYEMGQASPPPYAYIVDIDDPEVTE